MDTNILDEILDEIYQARKRLICTAIKVNNEAVKKGLPPVDENFYDAELKEINDEEDRLLSN